MLALATALWPLVCSRAGMLHPQDSESREVKSLDGLWQFKPDYADVGMRDRWHTAPLPPPTLTMPVPSSYNDLTQDAALREHVGMVWYERDTFVPLHWMSRRVVLFVGSANHHATVYVNGQRVGDHEGGHLPFHLPLQPVALNFGKANRITIAINNTLTTTTIPPGFVQTNVAGRRVQRLQMDFFHYAGLHRQVAPEPGAEPAVEPPSPQSAPATPASTRLGHA
jgi:beta-glucuronidase